MGRAELSIPPQRIARVHIGDADIDEAIRIDLAGRATRESTWEIRSHQSKTLIVDLLDTSHQSMIIAPLRSSLIMNCLRKCVLTQRKYPPTDARPGIGTTNGKGADPELQSAGRQESCGPGRKSQTIRISTLGIQERILPVNFSDSQKVLWCSQYFE
jgi:hypothetical protein